MSTINIHKPYVGSPNLANYRGTTLWMKFTPRSAPCLSIMASSPEKPRTGRTFCKAWQRKKKVAGGSPPKYANNRLLIPKDFMVKSLSFLDFSGSITNFVSSTPDTTPKSGRPNKRRNLRRDAVQCC